MEGNTLQNEGPRGIDRRAQLAQLLRQQADAPAVFPLSPAQQRLWFFHQLYPSSTAYNIHFAAQIRGVLDTEALKRSLQMIVRRHAVLRTNFTAVSGQPVQIVARECHVAMPLFDLREAEAAKKTAELKRLASEQSERPFDLTSEPLLRTTLVRLEENICVFLLTIHHIISDGWSLSVLMRDLAACYAAVVVETEPRLPNLLIQYTDFAVWQQQRMRSDALSLQRAYWRQQLQGAATLRLPLDGPRPAVQTFNGARQRLYLAKRLSVGLKALSQREDTTLFMLLLAAVDALLYHYSGQTDIVVGAPVAGRLRPELEGLIGLFINTLVLRADLSGNPSFCDLLARVRAVTLDAYSHQDVPFEQVVDDLQPTRDLSRNPLFQVLLILHNEPGWSWSLDGLTMTPLQVDRRASKVDLTVAVEDDGGELVVTFEYNTDLFQAASIGRMMEHLQTLLAVVVEDPERRLDQLLRMSEAEQRDVCARRPALAQPSAEANSAIVRPFVAPRTALEQRLAEVWSHVLRIERVGIYDNFFDLGGDSIRSVQVLARIREHGVSCSLQQLFQYQTIGALAEHLREDDNDSAASRQTAPFDLVAPDDRSKLPADLEDAYPLAQLQSGMLYHSDLSHDRAIYRHITSLSIQAPLDASLLHATIKEVVSRHPVLRTSFSFGTFSEPLQLVHRDALVPFEVVDLRGRPPDVQKLALRQWFEAEQTRPFEWSCTPLIRFYLHLRSDDAFQFSFTSHHAILDGWSMASMLVEIFRGYMARMRGQPELETPAPSFRFRDLVAAERQALNDEDQQRFWSDRLNSCPLVALPRWPRSAQRSSAHRTEIHSISIDAEVYAGLARLARHAGVPLKSVLLAAHLRVHHLLTGEADVVTGVVCNTRPEVRDGDRALGLFLNTIPFRLRLVGGSWIDLVRETFQAECEALPFRAFPLARLLTNLKRQTLFETAFNFIHYHIYQHLTTLDDLHVVDGRSFTESHFTLDVTFRLDEAASQLHLSLAYDVAELCDEQVVAIGAYYRSALALMAHYPDARYDVCDLLPAAERDRLLYECNATQASYPSDKCLHQLFEAQAARTPQAIALVGADNRISYCELDRRANQFAHYLRGHGVGPETPVGLCIQRSAAMVVALLGILKAGGAYVPLDPAYPHDRLAFMVHDSRTALIVTEQSLVARFATWAVPTVCLDQDSSAIAGEPEQPPDCSIMSANLAYIIYTSGSTGRPKGVQIPHSAVVNFLTSMRRMPGLTEHDMLLAVTTLSFDIAALELFLPLIVGARLAIASRACAGDGTQLLSLARAYGTTVLQATPTTWRLLLEAGLATRDRMRLLCGGEALPVDLAARLLATGNLLWNLYGPTETTIWSTIESVQPTAGPIAIGHPIANTQIYVLDSKLQPVPVGVMGELYIAGAGLARGYRNQPGHTAERFVPDPFSRHAGARMYRTGDIARYLPNGRIELLGRRDQQVKVRGFRIELGEIEAALAQHPVVSAAVVMVHEDAGNRQLVAYLVLPANSTLLDAAEMRQFLRARLPEYMIPAVFVRLEKLPLTPNGKIDRQALPAPVSARLAPAAYVAPTCPTEAAIVDVWRQLFHSDRIGINDNFFDLGGHSLLAMQLMSRLRVLFQLDLPLRSLFDHPTVAALGQLVQHQQSIHASERSQPAADRPHIPFAAARRESGLATFPLSFAQERLWFLSQLMPDNPFYTMATGLRMRGSLDVHTLRWSLDQIMQRHAILRTTFAVVDGQPVQRIAANRPFPFTIVDLRAWPATEREARIGMHASDAARHPFNLEAGPLLRAVLFQLDTDDHALVLVLHHIISDSWSMHVLFRELTVLYTAYSRGTPAQLPNLPVQYVDIAVWQRQQLHDERLEDELAYWERRLANPPARLALPTDHSKGTSQTFRGATRARTLPPEIRIAVEQLSRREQATPFMTLLAVFAVLLARYSDQEDLLIGVPTSGRDLAETEGLIGFFVNTLALRVDVSGNPPFAKLLRHVRERAIEAFAHDDLPFERLVARLRPERHLSQNPLFQVMFSYQESLPLQLPDLDVRSFAVETGSAKFDLSLDVSSGLDGLWIALEYNSDLFETATGDRMLEQFATLLEGLLANPSTRIWDVPLLTAVERQTVLACWSRRDMRVTDVRCIHQLFEAAAHRTPDAEAVVVYAAHEPNLPVERVTYGELDRRANRLAWRLRSIGVGPEVRVGICVERSMALIVSVLAVLKAGGAYVPLDPHYPRERLEYVIRDADAHVLLTHERLAGELIDCHVMTICVDAEPEPTFGALDRPPPRVGTPDNLAYVVYTSGSTGHPKGVMVTHRSFAHAYSAWKVAYALPDVARTHLQMASFSFDVFSGDLARALCSGARLVLCPREWLLDHELLYRVIRSEQVDCAEFVPAVLMPLVAYLEQTGQSLPGIKLLIAGSDSLHTADYQRIRRRCHAQTRVINSYGLSEATIDSSFFEVASDDLPPGDIVPIGRPLDGTEMYVLDRHMHPVPVGVAGELYIGGTGLARGYLNRPDLTAERFAPHPFSDRPGERLYRTGDRARFLADGTIAFLGRVDGQVKIRGLRIDPDEIAAALGEHPAVRESVVVAREGCDDRSLIAYVVASGMQTPKMNELDRFLRRKLPAYMLPSAFVILDALPLTPNGKIDRHALPPPEPDTLSQAETYIAPRDDLERRLAAIWESLLNIRPIGVTSDFFALGGHSLLAARLVAQIREQMHQSIPLCMIFERPTIEYLADVLRRGAADTAGCETG